VKVRAVQQRVQVPGRLRGAPEAEAPEGGHVRAELRGAVRARRGPRGAGVRAPQAQAERGERERGEAVRLRLLRLQGQLQGRRLQAPDAPPPRLRQERDGPRRAAGRTAAPAQRGVQSVQGARRLRAPTRRRLPGEL